MSRLLSRFVMPVSVAVLLTVMLFASSGANIYPYQYQRTTVQQQRHFELLQRGAKPSYQWRQFGKTRQLMTFPTQIQHVVVIDMENRTVDNLFSGYYGLPFNSTQTWNQVMNIANPNGNPSLLSNQLGAKFDPLHHHGNFLAEAQTGGSAGCFDQRCESFSCPNKMCGQTVTGYSYVPVTETPEYAWFMEHYASADDVLQANQGPSMPSHQYLISGQSGGILGSIFAPYALANNPSLDDPVPEPTGNDDGTGPDDLEQGLDNVYCPSGGSGYIDSTLDMTQHFPEKIDGNPTEIPCETYTSGTILDEMAALGGPTNADWQFISAMYGGYWAAPTAVKNLWLAWSQKGPNDPSQSFVKDPNAYNFVQNIKTGGTRPFAALTYITPCANESDHADVSGTSVYGPAWVGTIVNTIGESSYWKNTVIIVTWDDWGGWYDHMGWVESMRNLYPNGIGHPAPNTADPNEWGLRVPLMVISPYVKFAGYVSHGPAGATLSNPIPRSQSAILNLIETLFNVNPLYTDDYANRDASNNVDNMMDLFNFGGTNQLNFVPAPIYQGYQLLPNCSPPPIPPPP